LLKTRSLKKQKREKKIEGKESESLPPEKPEVALRMKDWKNVWVTGAEQKRTGKTPGAGSVGVYRGGSYKESRGGGD